MFLMRVRGFFDRRFEGFLGRVVGVEERLVEEVAESALGAARQLVPVRSGRLSRSLRIEPRGRLERHVVMGGARAPHAPYVEHGTRPHLIRPRRARALRFEVDGEIIYARLVHHPGTSPMEVMARAAEEALKELPGIARRTIAFL